MLRIFFLLVLVSFLPLSASANSFQEITVVSYCDGTSIVHTAPGKLERRQVEKNLPGCTQSQSAQEEVLPPSEPKVVSTVTNCDGLQIITYDNGTLRSQRVEENTPSCILTSIEEMSENSKNEVTEKATVTLDAQNKSQVPKKPILDLTSSDIVAYRAKLLHDRGVRFADAVRSARMRRAANMQSETATILMRNDAVVIEGKETGWVKTQGADLEVIDKNENTVASHTGGKAKGYIASKFLRSPNASDLVTIEQADHAYWSDIAVTKVARYVNVRSHPNYTAKIVTTLGDGYPLYVVSTVDNWSLVRNDEGTVSGYIRSDFLQITKYQRVDRSRGVLR